MNILVDKGKCIGCGLCVADCPRKCLEIVEGKAAMIRDICMECSHCLAICPQAAIRMEGYDYGEVLEYDDSFAVDPQTFLKFLKFRRTARKYSDKAVEADKIRQIIEAGRYSATACNLQPLRFIVMHKNLTQIKCAAYKALYNFAITAPQDEITRIAHGNDQFAPDSIKLYRQYEEEKVDSLFYDADTVIAVVGGRTDMLTCGIAVSNMELMTQLLGLGACFVSFFECACEVGKDLRRMLGIRSDEKVLQALAIGYTPLRYRRTVNRKTARITGL